jgi:hypothetical protein
MAETAEKRTVLKDGTVELVLPSGAEAVLKPYKGKHIRIAQKLSQGDETKLVPAIISQVVTVNGKPVIMEDMDEMHGPDVLKLMGEFGNL